MARKKEQTKICDSCGSENTPRAKQCVSCGKDRFAPRWVRKLGKVNRNTYVQVTQPLDKEEDVRVTLYKWWPGDNASFHINSAQHWEIIKKLIDEELAPYLKWQSRKAIDKKISDRKKSESATKRDLKKIAQDDIAIFTGTLKGLDLEKLTQGDYIKIGESISELADILLSADESLRSAIRHVIQKLPKQGAQAIGELSQLMESLTLRQITAVTTEVHRRINTINTFEERALDDRTYEITGDGSIHRLLENAMWIIDEHYWLMHSNKTLRTVVGNELAKKDKKYEKKRPDFVCGTVDNTLIVIELKRPSHTLQVDDLNQLEEYLKVIERYQGKAPRSCKAILVGQQVDDELRQTLRHRASHFSVMTFSDLIEDTRKRYKKYLKEIG